MFDCLLKFALPVPWKNKTFETSKIGAINFLVGPNGSGKTQFSMELIKHLPDVRILNTDRLRGMEQNDPLKRIIGDHFGQGYEKRQFASYKEAGRSGAGIDTMILLEERTDLRIQVEATLGHLFNRTIRLEWDSGRLFAYGSIGTSGAKYRIDRDECHGIKELIILLTHLYNEEYKYLIVDEPELNLHPQYQAFFMQEVRRVAGNPQEKGKKGVFLITHSPFMLDFKNIDDVKSVISFSLNHEAPTHIYDLCLEKTERLKSLVPRLNVHHKQLFFSDTPIFVEGILDAQIVSGLQEARGVSVAGAGSSIIDVGGCEEVNKYLELCLVFKKQAFFLYDLDSLFTGSLRKCIRNDEEVTSFLATAGLGGDFTQYCGTLDKTLTQLIDKLIKLDDMGSAKSLVTHLKSLGDRKSWDKSTFGKARVAVLTAISNFREDMEQLLSVEEIAETTGKISKITEMLRVKNIYLLHGGALEHYLPEYVGNPYDLKDEQKRAAVEAELAIMETLSEEKDFKLRYRELYEIVAKLPSKLEVDYDSVLKNYLGQYIHDLQSAIVNNSEFHENELQTHMSTAQKSMTNVCAIRKFVRQPDSKFSVEIIIKPMLGKKQRKVLVTHSTNAGIGDFNIVEDE